jgi:NADH-quinone oxidoreductase subunit M
VRCWWLLVPDRFKLPNWIALVTTLATFGLTLHLPAHFDKAQTGFQFVVNRQWIEKPAIFYHLGVDGLSLWLVVLVGLLAPIGVVASWNAIRERRKLFFALFLVQQTAMLGVFLSLDLIFYYGFWELSLVPMAILIAMYGRKDGPRAALKFFLFTFIPSAPLLVAILWLYAQTGSFDFALCSYNIASGILPAGAFTGRRWRFSSPLPSRFRSSRCTAGWRTPSAKRRSPSRWSSPASWASTPCCASTSASFPSQARAVAPVLVGLAVVGILYGACLALVQRDFWRLMAFAALSHLSLITLGIYGLTLTGWEGAVYQILNHGVVDGALFLLLGLLYDRYASSEINAYGGLAAKLRARQHSFVIASLAMIGLPMLGGFVGEF